MAPNWWQSFAAVGLRCPAPGQGKRTATCSIAGRAFITSPNATAKVFIGGWQSSGGHAVANGRNSRVKGDSGRDSGGFIALPWSVMDCPAYARLSHPAKALLLEVARQFVRDNNGRLLTSGVYLARRGWKSSDVITRAKRELLDAGFIFETVKGHRPNRASWYAVTWQRLDKLPGYDTGAALCFERGAYQK